MGKPRSEHRPLRAGIAIMPFDGEEHRGTLGAIARRKSDLARVLVTAVHVVSTHRNNFTVNGTESIYQGGNEEDDKIGQLFRQTVNGIEKKSWVEADQRNMLAVDAAALALPTGADIEDLTSFNIHFPNDDDDNHVHVEKRPIVGPAVDPTSGMKLTVVGAGSGQRNVTVLDHSPLANLKLVVVERDHPHRTVATFWFDKTKNFTLSQRNEPSKGYDSGSPILCVDEHGNYRIVGIHFGGKNVKRGGPSVIGYASRALAIEEELGITFGVKMPTAVAGDDVKVSTGASVTLDGVLSQSNEVLRDVLKYKWEKQASLTDTTLTQVATTRRYTFQAPATPETQVYKLTVTDGFGAKHTDTVNVEVKLANAGDAQTVNQGARVWLGPSGVSISAIGGIGGGRTYSWVQDMKGSSMPRVTLKPRTSARTPRFTAPNQAGKLKFLLTVTEGTGKKAITDTDDVVITVRGAKPSKPSSGQWDVRHSNGKIQFRVKSLPTVSPAVSQVRARLVAGISPNVTEVTKTLGTGLNTWVTALSSGDTQWQTGSWAAQIRFENSAGNSAYSGAKSVTVPTPAPKPKPPTTPTPTPPPAPGTVSASATHNSVSVTWSAVSGATSYVLQVGKMEEDDVVGYDDFATTSLTYTVGNLFSNTRYYYRVKSKNAAGEGTPSAAGSLITPVAPAPPTPPPPPVTPPTPWVDVSPPKYQGCGPSRKKQQTRVNNGVTEYRWVSASEPLKWGKWTDTGRKHYDDADGRLYKEQRRTSHCGDTETQWVVA